MVMRFEIAVHEQRICMRTDLSQQPTLDEKPQVVVDRGERNRWNAAPDRGVNVFWGIVSVGSDDGLVDHLTLVCDRQTVLRGQLTELFMGKAHDYRMIMIIKRTRAVSTEIFPLTSKTAGDRKTRPSLLGHRAHTRKSSSRTRPPTPAIPGCVALPAAPVPARLGPGRRRHPGHRLRRRPGRPGQPHRRRLHRPGRPAHRTARRDCRRPHRRRPGPTRQGPGQSRALSPRIVPCRTLTLSACRLSSGHVFVTVFEQDHSSERTVAISRQPVPQTPGGRRRPRAAPAWPEWMDDPAYLAGRAGDEDPVGGLDLDEDPETSRRRRWIPGSWRPRRRRVTASRPGRRRCWPGRG